MERGVWNLELAGFLMSMSGSEIREKFLQFFKDRGHTIVPSSSLVPHDDPSVLLTTAGMQQFKPYFLGKPSPFGNRTASVQKSFRTSDIGEVGDETHNTFFEMLGNFSFGYPKSKDSYFKEEAIFWGLEFLQDVLGIERQRILASIFGGDKEVPQDQTSLNILKKIGFAESEIKKGNRSDNFWGPTGNEGPCGPTTEFIIDGVETWNLVFNEYFMDSKKRLTKLSVQGVDTGMGMERIARAVQNVNHVYQTDLFAPILSAISKTLPFLDERGIRVIADHLRGSVFLIADGVLPGNKEQGYILRRLLRRSLVVGRQGKGQAGWYEPVIETIINEFRSTYPELGTNREQILRVMWEEAEKFGKTLERGIKEFGRLSAKKTISGQDAFALYETFGFPIELTEELAHPIGVKVDRSQFEKAQKAHQEKSRIGAKAKFGGHGLLTPAGEIVGGTKENQRRIIRLHTATHLLHQALRDTFGDTVKQMGSDVNSERLRFDFSYSEKIGPTELKKVEAIVNKKVAENLPVYRKKMSRREAEKTGALAFFKDKYGGTVTVYFIGSDDPVKAYSKEFCAGPHVASTGEIGRFTIQKEEAIGSGVRRIRATVA